MLSIVLAGSMLAVVPPALPDEPAGPPVVEEVAPPAEPEPAVEAIVIEAPAAEAPVAIEAPPAALPVAEEAAPVEAPPTIVITDRRVTTIPAGSPAGPRVQFTPAPPWSGTARFVGGSIMLIAGVGLLSAATLEFADGRDTTQPLISQVPAGVSMLAAGGLMIGTGARDQRRLSEWEAATGRDARPTGNGLIVAGVTVSVLGAMSAVATSIAVDMDLDAPRSIPAGWATAGVALAGGSALLIGGIVRRVRYGKWRDGLRGVPMVAPTRAGATVGFVGQF